MSDVLTATVCDTLLKAAGKKFSYREPVLAIQMSGAFELPNGDKGEAGDMLVGLQDGGHVARSLPAFDKTFKSHRKPRKSLTKN